MEGILLINKPVGPSSFAVVRYVRKLSGIKKVGHAGTLDPLASGLMVVCLGRYTKLAGVLTSDHKSYQATLHMGVATSTDDGEGEVIATKSIAALTKSAIEQALGQFVGLIKQTPPQFSAVKVHGQRAYALARAQQVVALRSREVHITKIEMLDCSLPEVRVHIDCSKGTYVRALARDVGEALKVYAHASAIHRVRSGSFAIADAHVLSEVTKDNIGSLLLKNHDAVAGLEMVEVDQEDKANLICGRTLKSMPLINNNVAIACHQGELVAILGKVEGRTIALRVL